jgi:hypothetical protein
VIKGFDGWVLGGLFGVGVAAWLNCGPGASFFIGAGGSLLGVLMACAYRQRAAT